MELVIDEAPTQGLGYAEQGDFYPKDTLGGPGISSRVQPIIF